MSIMCRVKWWGIDSRRHRCGLRPDHEGPHECIGNCGGRADNESASAVGSTT